MPTAVRGFWNLDPPGSICNNRPQDDNDQPHGYGLFGRLPRDNTQMEVQKPVQLGIFGQLPGDDVRQEASNPIRPLFGQLPRDDLQTEASEPVQEAIGEDSGELRASRRRERKRKSSAQKVIIEKSDPQGSPLPCGIITKFSEGNPWRRVGKTVFQGDKNKRLAREHWDQHGGKLALSGDLISWRIHKLTSQKRNIGLEPTDKEKLVAEKRLKSFGTPFVPGNPRILKVNRPRNRPHRDLAPPDPASSWEAPNIGPKKSLAKPKAPRKAVPIPKDKEEFFRNLAMETRKKVKADRAFRKERMKNVEKWRQAVMVGAYTEAWRVIEISVVADLPPLSSTERMNQGRQVLNAKASSVVEDEAEDDDQETCLSKLATKISAL